MIKKTFLIIAVLVFGIITWTAFNPSKAYAQGCGLPFNRYCCTPEASCYPSQHCAGAPACVWGWQDCNGNGVPDTAGDYYARLETCDCSNCSGGACTGPSWDYYYCCTPGAACDPVLACDGAPACVMKRGTCADGTYRYGLSQKCEGSTACCSGGSCVSCAAPATPTPTSPPTGPTGWISCSKSVVYFDPGPWACGNDGFELCWETSNAPDPRVYVVSEDGTETLMHMAVSGCSHPDWLCAGHVAVFKLYANGQSNLLGSCSVTGRYTPGTPCGSNYRCVYESTCLPPTPTPKPPATPTPEPGKAHLTFKVKFQGIFQQRPDKKVKVTLKNGQTFENINVTSDASGIYSGVVNNITLGAYEVLIKGPVHLQKNFGSVTFSTNQTVTKDWSGTVLITGDAISNNKIDIFDYNQLVGDFGPRMPPTGSPADFDSDGDVDIFDYNFLVGNFNQVGD